MLNQAKKKIPLLLPGFESIEGAEEYSGPFSDVVNILLTPLVASLCIIAGDHSEGSGTVSFDFFL